MTATLVQAQAEAAEAIHEATALADEGCRRVRDRFPEWGVDIKPVVGPPAQAIIQTAEHAEADLVVVGSHGRSALGRLLLGSVSKHIATESRHSVRVARHVVDRGHMPVRIVIGVDASMGARAAVRPLDARAWRAGTEIRVVGADETVAATGTISLVPTAAAWVKESNDAELTEIRAGLEDAARHLLNAGLLVSTRIKKGSAADVLKDEARAWDADCIVVGWRRSNSERVRAGSVARALVSTAPCTVEIVRSHGRE